MTRDDKGRFLKPQPKSKAKPLIAEQMADFKDACIRCFGGEFKGVLCLGPAGCGKNIIVQEAARECNNHPLNMIQNATLFGIIDELRKRRNGTHWFDDFDEWMHQQQTVNFFKILMEKVDPRIVKIDRNTIREGVSKVPFSGKVIITSNATESDFSPSMQKHLTAMSSRFYPIAISSKPGDILEYIDWLICERDYFRSPLLWQTEKIKPLSLKQVNQVLQFIHAHADRMPLTLRAVNGIAREIKRDDDWKARCERRLKEDAIKFVAPPAPVALPWGVRNP